jgi:hypothetical protein
MATQEPQQQVQTGGNAGQSAWHHAVSTYGDMGQQHGGVGNAIAMKGGRRRKSRRQRQSSGRRQRQTWGKRQRQSRRQSQRGGRK